MDSSNRFSRSTWQAEMSKSGFKFPDMSHHTPSRKEIMSKNEDLELCRIGKTVVETYLSGERRRITDYGRAHVVEILVTPVSTQETDNKKLLFEAVQPFDNPGFYAEYDEVA